jgi:plasmid maintenance system antidote protein VapI
MRCATCVSAAQLASGEILNKQFLKPLGLTANALALCAMTAALLAGRMAVRAKG